MPVEVFLVLGAVLTVTVGGWVYRELFSPRGRAKRALRRAPRVPIARARDGELVKLGGTLRLGDTPVTAPLTGRPCAFFQTTVERKRGSGSSSRWVKIIDERDFCKAVWIDDGTGRALVELIYPEVVLTMDNHFSSGFLDDPSADLEAFLARHGESSQGLVFNKTLRYREGMLEEGERVAVLGLCCWEPDPDPAAASGAGFRQQAMRLRVIGPTGGALLLSDDPGVLG